MCSRSGVSLNVTGKRTNVIHEQLSVLTMVWELRRIHDNHTLPWSGSSGAYTTTTSHQVAKAREAQSAWLTILDSSIEAKAAVNFATSAAPDGKVRPGTVLPMFKSRVCSALSHG